MNPISEYLTKYNAWRRKENDLTMDESGIHPTDLGLMLEQAIAAINLLEELRDCGGWYYSALEIDTHDGHDGQELKRRIDEVLK